MIQQDIQLNKLIDPSFRESVKKIIDYIIANDDLGKAFELASLLEKIITKYKNEIDSLKEIHDFYKDIIIKAKFIAFPLIDNEEAVDLIKKYFTWQFFIPDYNFLRKFRSKLINIEIFEDRDKFKEDLRKALLESEEKIIGKASLKMIKEWLRDYNRQLGADLVDNLKRTQYLTDLNKIKELDSYDREKLKLLFDFYEKLKLSSFVPWGFEEDIPIVIDDKFYIFKQGVLELVTKETNKARTVGLPVGNEKIIASLPPEPEKEDPLKAAPAGAGLEKEEELPNISRLISQARKEAEEKLAETTSTPPPIKPMTLEEVADQAERAISELKIILNPEEKNRLKNILVSFLKGIRDQIETKDALLKSKEEGGLNFTQRQVEQIFNLIKTEKPQEKKSPTKEKTFDVSFDEQMKDVLRMPSEDVKKKEALLQLQPPPPVILETFREKLKEKITSQPTLSQLSQPSIVSAETRGEPSQPSRPTPPPLPSQMPLIRQVRRIEVPEIKEIKPRLEDIKRSSFSGWKRKVELVGPIEEIRNLTLADLREMSDNPAKVLGKIKEKISLLEKESFLKKIQAIKAWRENEIYQLYLEIGRKVIQERTNLAKTLERRRSQGLPILTEEEISAIMDFNKTLRF